jgi:hypothetical protein
MRAGFAVQAVVAGGLDYTGAPGSVVAAAVHGAKLLVTMAYANKRSTISSRALRSLLMLNSGGRILGLGVFGGFSIEIPRLMLSKHGLDPKRDVTMVLIGATPDRLLRSGEHNSGYASGAFLQFRAYKDGFKKLGYSGDYFQTLQGAITTSERKLRTEADEVRRFTNRVPWRQKAASDSMKRRVPPALLSLNRRQASEPVNELLQRK